ncbi:hypothetical protein TSOC_003677 [Tetrabaena socialis]|uniref:Uncharacterized protein n=1 Tax=Tetrabaena socialis TaxID=47790 RepID=A0A2J8AAZ5_9CHLO|nr:hypothetical protein TSOC_003677 [Tetrabaena socialis]|eukprot:PNH09688.1 hypothetical protein TSOC_003677 [Tetrabaena socialis]
MYTTGAGGGVAFLSDLLQLAAAPLTLQAAATGALLRRHLVWLAAAWAMMRGTYGRRRGRAAGQPSPPPQQTSPQAPPPHSAPRARHPARSRHASAAGERLAGAAGGTRGAAAPGLTDGARGGGGSSGGSGGGGGGDGGGSGGGGGGDGGEAASRGVAPPGRGAARVPISRLESLLGLAPDPKAGNEVQVEQLIVGVLLLVPLLALLPSVVAWHLLALAAWGGPAAARAGLAAAGGLLRANPAVALAWRLLRPLGFPGPHVTLRPLVRHPAPPLPSGLTTQTPGSRDRPRPPDGCSSPRCYLVDPLPRPWGCVLGPEAAGTARRRGGKHAGAERPVPGPGPWAWAARAGRLLVGRELVLPFAGRV